jgi:hypothetical protein
VIEDGPLACEAERRLTTTSPLSVPRFLMLHQLTQAYYPSEVEQQSGIPEGEEDRA